MKSTEYVSLSSEYLEDKPIYGKFGYRDMIILFYNTFLIMLALTSQWTLLKTGIFFMLTNIVVFGVVKLKVHDDYLEMFLMKKILRVKTKSIHGRVISIKKEEQIDRDKIEL